ncbi:MAG: twin-arginine translocase TatA/TatE family subunit [Planctomycetota bacterium]
MSLPSAFVGPIGPWEFALIMAVGLLLFGKNLPEVGRQVGKSIVEFKRGLNQLKQQVTEDPALREARNALQDLKREVEAPRKLLSDVRDPVRMFENLTHQDLATPGPDAQHEPQPSGSFLDAAQAKSTDA